MSLSPLPTLSNTKTQLDKVVALRDNLDTRIVDLLKEIQELEGVILILDQTSELFRQLIDKEIVDGVKAVESLLSEGLSAVFDDQELSISSDVSVSRGKVSVDLITTHKKEDGLEISGSTNESFGGAVATVQSVLMRVIVMLRRGLRPVLLLDESLPAFDDNYVVNMGNFLSLICKRLGMDILLVTHNPSLVECSDHAYRISKVNGKAVFNKEK
jgi:hypothetical protein